MTELLWSPGTTFVLPSCRRHPGCPLHFPLTHQVSTRTLCFGVWFSRATRLGTCGCQRCVARSHIPARLLRHACGRRRRHSSLNCTNASAQTRSHEGQQRTEAPRQPRPQTNVSIHVLVKRWKPCPAAAGTRKQDRSCCFLPR